MGTSIRDQVDDARYQVRAWSQGVAWTTVIGGLGLVLTGWATRNSVMFSSGLTAVVVAFFPRARSKFIYEVANTWTMKKGWRPLPKSERPYSPEGSKGDSS
jgi:hypothetical protein